jgi:hypothetical protein
MTLIAACAIAAYALPASAAMTCADLPKAESFVQTLQPGPNTSAAQSHLEAAKSAGDEGQCVAELHQVDKYARRSAAADKRMASRSSGGRRVVQCADFLHQDRPGGSDYHGPYVPGCAKS